MHGKHGNPTAVHRTSTENPEEPIAIRRGSAENCPIYRQSWQKARIAERLGKLSQSRGKPGNPVAIHRTSTETLRTPLQSVAVARKTGGTRSDPSQLLGKPGESQICRSSTENPKYPAANRRTPARKRWLVPGVLYSQKHTGDRVAWAEQQNTGAAEPRAPQ